MSLVNLPAIPGSSINYFLLFLSFSSIREHDSLLRRRLFPPIGFSLFGNSSPSRVYRRYFSLHRTANREEWHPRCSHSSSDPRDKKSVYFEIYYRWIVDRFSRDLFFSFLLPIEISWKFRHSFAHSSVNDWTRQTSLSFSSFEVVIRKYRRQFIYWIHHPPLKLETRLPRVEINEFRNSRTTFLNLSQPMTSGNN